MTAERGKFAGVQDILRYNWHFYAVSLVVLIGIGAALWLRAWPSVIEAALITAATLTAFWAFNSLFVSWYVYDYVGVTRWEWMPRMLPFAPGAWVNIHAGLDESTPSLTRLLPNTEFTVLDIYNPGEMTEPSIARARLLHPSALPATPCSLDALPLPTSSRDMVFLLFAAHEIRQPARRTEFLREVARILSTAGQVVLVEHLRDWKNFLAFGPGFLHFHARHQWVRAAEDAGLTVQSETSITPFVRCFLLAPART